MDDQLLKQFSIPTLINNYDILFFSKCQLSNRANARTIQLVLDRQFHRRQDVDVDVDVRFFS